MYLLFFLVTLGKCKLQKLWYEYEALGQVSREKLFFAVSHFVLVWLCVQQVIIKNTFKFK